MQLIKWVVLATALLTTNQLSSQVRKTKVVLVGTFHYQRTAGNDDAFPDLFSSKRQSELQKFALSLAVTRPSKLFLEIPDTSQAVLNELYLQYKKNVLTDTNATRSEVVQLGFRIAGFSNAQVIAIDHLQAMDASMLDKYQEMHSKDSGYMAPYFQVDYPFATDKLGIEKSSVSDYYIKLNSIQENKRILYDYYHYAMAFNSGNNFSGEQFTLQWIDRNLKIYSNILRAIDPSTDETIIVVIDHAIAAQLKSFFELNPHFEVVELGKVVPG